MRQRQYLILDSAKIALLCLITTVFSVFWYLFYSKNLYTPFYHRGDYVVIVLFFLLNMGCSKLYGGFNLAISRITEIIYSQCIAIIMSHFFIYIVTWLLMRKLPNVLPVLMSTGICIVIATAWAKGANRLTNKVMPPRETVLIYDNREAYKNGQYIIRQISWRFRLLGEIDATVGMEKIFEMLEEQKPEAVMLCGLRSSQRNTVLKYCIERNVLVYLRPNIGDYIVNSARTIQMANLPVMLCYRAAPSIFYTTAKRAIDIALGLIGLVITSPIMLVTAIAVYAYDRGPVFYRQLRITKNKKPFYIYKFRSMRVDAEKDGIARLAGQNDDRITPVGKIIRACRIDELPQLLCILIGDMSIVGPRPERPEIAEEYERQMPEFSLRLQVKAGLTGYAQVFGKYNTDPYDKLQMDLMYISNQSLATDIKIMLATIKVLFIPESTEGVAQGQRTAKASEKKKAAGTERIDEFKKYEKYYENG